MKRHLLLAAALIAGFSSVKAATANGPPNIILVFADDLGWKDVGYQSDGKFLTPNIDAFAKQGMVFSNAYAGGANCAPSRACLMSGAYSPAPWCLCGPQHRPRSEEAPAARSDPEQPTAWLRNSSPWPRRSKPPATSPGSSASGISSGKDGALPSQQGFDVAYDSLGYGDLEEAKGGNQPGPPSDPKGVYHLTRKACEFIEENKDRPFFCYLAHHAIHSALQTRPETHKLVEQRAKKAGVPTLYMGCTYDLDDSFGILLDKLKELKLEDNTLLVFTSDNGAVPLSSQEPLRGNKGAYYEGGIREPFIVRWPGHVKPGTSCDIPVIQQDLYPTFLAAARAPVPAGATTRWRKPHATHRTKRRTPAQVDLLAFPRLPRPAGHPRSRYRFSAPVPSPRCARAIGNCMLYHEEWQLDGGRDKLATNNAVELYNLKTDPGERHNLVLTETATRDRLLDEMLAWMKSTGAKMPTEKNPAYDPNTKINPRLEEDPVNRFSLSAGPPRKSHRSPSPRGIPVSPPAG